MGDEAVLRAEDHAGAHDDRLGNRLAHAGLALGLAGRILRRRLRIGAHGRNLDEIADALLGAQLGHARGGGAMDGVEAGAQRLVADADQVDAGVGAAQRGLQVAVAADVAAYHLDLADIAVGLQVVGIDRVAHGDANAPSLARQSANHLLADKTGTAEDRDDLGHDRKSLKLRADSRAHMTASITQGLRNRNGEYQRS